MLAVEKLLCCHGQCCRNQGRVELCCPRLQALPTGMCHTRTKVSSRGYWTRLPSWRGSDSQCWFSVGAGKPALATPGSSSSKALTPQPMYCQPSTWRQFTLPARGRVSSGRSCARVGRCRIPSATKECPMTRFHLRGWEGG